MNKYQALKEKHQKEVNEFPMFFAFNQAQFEEGKEKLGITNDSEIVAIGYGGFIRKSDEKAYVDMHHRMNTEDREAMKDPEYCYWMFRYELGNYEYAITYDLEEMLGACGLTANEVLEDPALCEILERAKEDYLKECE